MGGVRWGSGLLGSLSVSLRPYVRVSLSLSLSLLSQTLALVHPSLYCLYHFPWRVGTPSPPPHPRPRPHPAPTCPHPAVVQMRRASTSRASCASWRPPTRADLSTLWTHTIHDYEPARSSWTSACTARPAASCTAGAARPPGPARPPCRPVPTCPHYLACPLALLDRARRLALSGTAACPASPPCRTSPTCPACWLHVLLGEWGCLARLNAAISACALPGVPSALCLPA